MSDDNEVSQSKLDPNANVEVSEITSETSTNTDESNCTNNSLNIENLKPFLKNIRKEMQKSNQVLQKFDRLSSGNPKLKSLHSGFTKLRQIEFHNSSEIETNCFPGFHKLKKCLEYYKEVVATEQPTQVEMEKIITIISEIEGRVKIMFDNLS